MKTLMIIGGVIVALLLAGYLFMARNLDGLVVKGVNTYGPQITQSKVELASASLSPLSGTGTLTGLTVGNPAGWSNGRAFYLGKVQIGVEPKSVVGDTVVINEIVIDQPEINYETKIVSSNIKDLLKNIESFAGPGEKKAEPAGKPKKFIVKKFRLTNGKATVQAGGQALAVPLPEISLDNLGVAEGGLTASQLAAAVTRDVLGKVVVATASAVGSGELSVDKLKDAANTLKKMFKGDGK
jgi:uncharacterized protein involved in outer membrane biogenesis